MSSSNGLGGGAQVEVLYAGADVYYSRSGELLHLGTGGILSVSGTANQITASTTSGATTLSLPAALIIPSTTWSEGNLLRTLSGSAGTIEAPVTASTGGAYPVTMAAANGKTHGCCKVTVSVADIVPGYQFFVDVPNTLAATSGAYVTANLVNNLAAGNTGGMALIQAYYVTSTSAMRFYFQNINSGNFAIGDSFEFVWELRVLT